MATVLEHEPADASPSSARFDTLQDLVDRLGGIPLGRIRATPPPGTATLDDLIRFNERKQGLCELVDGTLVEKTVGFRESLLTLAIGGLLRAFVVLRNLGLVTGADGTVQLCPGLARAPDVAVFAWKNLPEGKVPTAKVPSIWPTLAIEVLSEGNTKAEMERKRRECFAAGTLEFWQVDPKKTTITVYEAADAPSRIYVRSETLESRIALPGFLVVLNDLFGELDRMGQEPQNA